MGADTMAANAIAAMTAFGQSADPGPDTIAVETASLLPCIFIAAPLARTSDRADGVRALDDASNLAAVRAAAMANRVSAVNALECNWKSTARLSYAVLASVGCSIFVKQAQVSVITARPTRYRVDKHVSIAVNLRITVPPSE